MTILQVTLHHASLEAARCCRVQAVAEVEPQHEPRRCWTSPAYMQISGESGGTVQWNEDLAFVVEHSGRTQHLKLVLYRPAAEGEAGSGAGQLEYVAAGSLGLDRLLEEGQGGGGEGGGDGSVRQHRVSVPVVDEVGKHAGEVSCTLRITPPPPQRPEAAAHH
ncbi:family inverse autotransporter domain-containing [Micractinium conductrix]|uniref:Family inverse autotransporter domain-containing n=1 Tax=Micractinium conductrix TaxID=554055 RepID=A0A2P6V6G8_9CHLO|nr:family inverse autotransporter domain-containing [Micractinium conductrix]|eukprot:PSC69682.1 family inverse autotransporter domain-containing [Micractinium conductrix]